MLSSNRIAWLAAAILALAASAARAQDYPDDVRVFPPQDLRDMQPFAPADISTYGGAPRPHRGFFFTFDGLAWVIKAPDASPIGEDNPAGRPVYFASDANRSLQFTEGDTSPLRSKYKYGNRWEYGYVGRYNGLMGTTFQLSPLHQFFELSDLDMVIQDRVVNSISANENITYLMGLVTRVPNVNLPADGSVIQPAFLPTSQSLANIPVTFMWLDVDYETRVWGQELLYVRRFGPGHHGGHFDLYLGARYFSLEENYAVRGYGGALDTSYWNTEAQNHIIGPEIGGRVWWTKGRWTLEADGRFTAGYNRQNMRQQGRLGEALNPPGAVNSGRPYAYGPTGFTHHEFADEFAPIIETRLNLRFQIYRNLSVRVGYDMTWIEGVVRPANIVQYEMPDFGINSTQNREALWLTGVNVGVEINR